jgi:hypothetical protein
MGYLVTIFKESETAVLGEGLVPRGGAFGWGIALQAGRSRVQFPMVLFEFFFVVIIPVALSSWGL